MGRREVRKGSRSSGLRGRRLATGLEASARRCHIRARGAAAKCHSAKRHSAGTMVTYLDAATAPLRNTGQIRLYGAEGFAGMRKACDLTARCLDELAAIVAPGVTTEAIDRFVFEFGMDHGALPATLNYRGYTKSCCTSINHVVCHGIPDDKPLRTATSSTSTSPTSSTAGMAIPAACIRSATIKRAAERLLEVTHECLMRGIAAVQARRPHRRHRRGHPDLCRGRALLGGARFLRPWRRPAVPRRAEHPALRQRRAKASRCAKA